MEELEAIQRCRGGDCSAFRLLVENYGDLVTRSAYLMTHDHHLADELAQDTFLAAWRGLATFEPGRPFRPWLMRILVNAWLNRRRRGELPTEPLDETAASDRPSPEEWLLRHDLQQSMRKALRSLDEGQRLALVLRYYAGLSVPEIAGALSCPEGTVKSRLHRALAELRALLQGQDVASVGPGLPRAQQEDQGER